MKTLFRLALVFCLNLSISLPISAKTVEEKDLHFSINSESLMKGDIHYFYQVTTPRKAVAEFPDLFDLDSLSLLQESNVQVIVTKSAVIVNKPVGFFDDKQMLEERYVAHVMGEQKIRKLGVDSFKVTVPGEQGYSYKMQSFFDADDVSTLPNSKVIKAVSAAKKLDVISQSASTIVFTEKTQFTKFSEGGVSVSSFVPMKENKTLVISYNLYALKKDAPDKEALKENFLDEVVSVKQLKESFK